MNRAYLKCAGIFLTALFLTGCSIADMQSTIRGSHYLSTGDYQGGIQTFREVVRNDPDGAAGQYYLGRFLLADRQADAALKHFQKATALSPGDPDYWFWLGLTYGVAGDTQQEKLAYQKVLRISPSHLQASLYLGHLALREGKLEEALKLYEHVLKYIEANPTALYNKALIFHRQQKTAQARKAWKNYLKYYPAGYFAARATNHLNELGDFTWRNQVIGMRTVTVKNITFQKESNVISIKAYPSLRFIAKVAANLGKGKLQVVVFAEGDAELARRRAMALQKKLYEFAPVLSEEGVEISWFGRSERVLSGGREYQVADSVRFFVES